MSCEVTRGTILVVGTVYDGFWGLVFEIVWKELGEDLLVICLDMDMEEQMGRIRSRHSGDEKVVERMKTVYNLCQPADLDESNAYEVRIDGGKSPLNVLQIVIEKINTR